MKNILLSFAAVFALANSIYGQQLVSASLLGQKSKTELLVQFNNLPFIQFGAKYYRVTYTTKSVQGVPDTASGLLVVPDNPNRLYPRLVYQHGTSGSKQDVPSINVLSGGEGILGQLFAGLGYVAFLPDYLGLGNVSKGFHPYVHAASEAWAALDMLRAGEEFLQQQSVQTNQQIFVAGYSQGGHAAMALHRAIELEHPNEFSVTAAAPMSGPYSISGVMRDLILTDKLYYYPAYIPNTALSYQTVYGNLFNDVEEIFRQPYADLVQDFYEGKTTLSALNTGLIALLTANEGDSYPFRMLQPDLVQAVQNDPNHPVNLALADNDTYNNWLPKAPMRLFYCTADDQVPYLNSIVAQNALVAVGAPDFATNDVMPTANHGECVVPAMTGTVIFFLGFQQIGTVGTAEAAQGLRATLFPNPAPEAVYVSGLESPCQYRLFDSRAQPIGSGTLAPGDNRLDISALPSGIYWLQLQSRNAQQTIRWAKP
jgi:acetyl esterase/lipase